MNNIKQVSTGYVPRPFQAAMHRKIRRFNVFVCHRRFGKTVMSINEMIDQALRCDLKNPQYAYLAPTYSQAKKIAWQYIKDYTNCLPNVSTNEQELRLTIERPAKGDKVVFYLLGAESYDNHRGIYLDGLILDEYGDMHPDVWGKVFRPALSDRKGWAIFIGTPKGQNHFYDIYSFAEKTKGEWYAAKFRASETGVIPESELESSKISMSKEEYDQEFECSFNAAMTGAYYGHQLVEAREKNRITKVPYDSAIPVVTSWDLGINDTTAIWFAQVVFNEVRFIDFYEVSGKGLPDIIRVVNSKPYIYERHFLPHDAAARDLSTGVTRQETMRGLGLRNSEIIPRQAVSDRINAARIMLGRSWFDETNTEKGLIALQNYQKKFDSKLKVFSDHPLHDWSSNAADSYGYMALGLGLNLRYDISKKNLPQEADGDFSVF